MVSLFLGECAPLVPKNGDKPYNPSAVPTSEVYVPVSITPTLAETPTPEVAETDNRFVLDEEKLDSLARTYLADTMQASIDVARSIDWFPNDLNEHPSNMCGPLSGQILVDAGIIRPIFGDELKKTFWYTKADRDQYRLLDVFPENQFEWRFIDSAFGAYDFDSDPLKPGDWVYLTANKGGSFEHMLTVTRVERDETGHIVAAYSVNNVYIGKSADGENQYNIVESKLYDTRTGEHYEYGYPNNKFDANTGSTFVIVRRNDVVYSGNP